MPHIAHEQVDRRLQYVLQALIQQLGADLASLYTFSDAGGHLNLVALHDASVFTQQELALLDTWATAQIETIRQQNTYTDRIAPVDDAITVKSALIFPLTLYNDLIGAIVVFSRQSQYFQPEHVHHANIILEMARTVLENQRLAERLMTTEAIATTAQAIASDPTPQNIVNVLRDFLFGAHVASCVIALFGPVSPEAPYAPFEYLEVVGSWTRGLGSEVGIGTRYMFEDYPEQFAQLFEEKYVTYEDISWLDHQSMIPFVAEAQLPDDIGSLTALILESDSRKLGVLVITIDQHYTLSPHEIRTYQIVTEFLTMSTLAAALRQQADFVQQGRAALLDAVTDGVVMVLPDETSSILTINERFAELFGVREPDVQGTSLWHLVEIMRVPRGVRRTLLKTWRSLSPDDPGKIHGEFRMTSATGTPTDIQWYSAPVYRQGQVIGRIYTFHDITPERTAERLRSELLSRISHELRTPLTSIRGFAEFILEAHTGDELPPLAREYTQIIHKSALHLNTLFTDIIELTRADAGQVKLEIQSASLPAVINDVVIRLEPQVRANDQHIILNLPEATPQVEIDIDRIDQVLTNLISNALKYSPQHTDIHVEVRTIETEKTLPPDAPPDVIVPCILVGVIDQGHGLHQDEVDKIFLPFYRTADARRAKVEGAGLGLAISQTIVELHRGRLWAQPATRRESGGRFFFTVPINEH